MKFLVDECTGTSVVACLRDEGHDAVAVVEVMPEADDREILDWAVFKGRRMEGGEWRGEGGTGETRRETKVTRRQGDKEKGRQGADDEGRVGASRRTITEPLRCSH